MNYKRLYLVILLGSILIASTGCVSGGILYHPYSKARLPAVIILHTKGGVSPLEHEFASRLLRNGYAALVVDYFSEGGVDNIEVGYDSLRSNPRIDPGRIGIVGFSLGAKEAISFAQYSHDFTDRRIKAIVSFYIGPYVPRGPEKEHPAILFLHGDQDVHTLPKQIYHFCAGKSEAGIVCEVQIYAGVRHAFDRENTEYNGYDLTTAEDSWERAVSFLDKHVKNAAK